MGGGGGFKGRMQLWTHSPSFFNHLLVVTLFHPSLPSKLEGTKFHNFPAAAEGWKLLYGLAHDERDSLMRACGFYLKVVL